MQIKVISTFFKILIINLALLYEIVKIEVFCIDLHLNHDNNFF